MSDTRRQATAGPVQHFTTRTTDPDVTSPMKIRLVIFLEAGLDAHFVHTQPATLDAALHVL